MTIRAQQLQIPGIGRPVFEPAPPRVSGFGLDLSRGVDVVNVERANVIKPAPNALAAKLFNKGNFLCPVFWVFVNCGSVLVPICLLALWGAVANLARLSTAFARAIAAPSVREVAPLATVFPVTVFNAVRVHECLLAAASAMNGNAFVSHARTIADFFVEKPKPAKQEALL